MIENDLIAGKYQVVRKIGEGASGQVYLVRHADLNIRLALKILRSDFSRDSLILESFKREAEVLFRFSHEGCVQLRDFGALPDGSYFMATDFSEGGTLRDLLIRIGRMDWNYTLRLISKILDVLGAAHQRGIIHRDIKPENVMIERDFRGNDNIKVLDFGVAHLLSLESALIGDDGFMPAVGTPCYMSPEQALGDPKIDGRSDLYSVGIVAYEMMVGRVPFDHPDIMKLLCMQVAEPPTPFPDGYFIPSNVEELIMKALNKDRADRFNTAEQFNFEIQTVLKQLENSNLNETTNVGKESVYQAKQINEGIQTKADSKETEFEVLTEQAPLDVLFIDDDPNLLSIVPHILLGHGINVKASSDIGIINFELFANDVKLLLTDVNMPGIDGVRVCKLFKKAVPDLKVILFSNLTDRELLKLQKEAGADGYISKNSDPKGWGEKIKSLALEQTN